MAGIKISALDAAPGLLTTSIFAIVYDPSLSPATRVTYKMTAAQLITFIQAAASQVIENTEDPPTTAPPAPTKPALHTKSGGGPIFQWDVGSQTWL